MMSKGLQKALDSLGGIGSVDELRSLAEAGLAPAARPGVNSHIHLPPNFSAFETVAQALDLARDQGIALLGVTNYYDYEVYGEFMDQAIRRGIFPLLGLEVISLVPELQASGVRVNDPGNPGRMYLCGKGAVGLARPCPRAAELLGRIRRNDTERMAKMTVKVAEVFASAGLAADVNDGDVIDMIVARHGCQRESVTLQERHIAQFFQELLFEQVPVESRMEKLAEILARPSQAGPDEAVKIQGEIRSALIKAGKAAFVEETFLDFPEAYELILATQAIPCYPTLADGTSPLCDFEISPEKLVAELRGRGIYMAEFIPPRNSPETLGLYVRAMRSAGIAVVGGTEHNTLDLIALDPACRSGAPLPEDVREIFYEGMAVAVAHQFLVLNGQVGFVEANGTPAGSYGSDDARIRAFAKLGRAVLEKFYQGHRGG
jgi:hypothetical protein